MLNDVTANVFYVSVISCLNSVSWQKANRSWLDRFSVWSAATCVYFSSICSLFSQYTIQTSACGQNILSTVDEANVKEKVLVKQGNQEGRFRGRRAWKRIWIKLDAMLAYPETKAPRNLFSLQWQQLCVYVRLGINLGWRSTLLGNRFTSRWTTDGMGWCLLVHFQ